MILSEELHLPYWKRYCWLINSIAILDLYMFQAYFGLLAIDHMMLWELCFDMDMCTLHYIEVH